MWSPSGPPSTGPQPTERQHCAARPTSTHRPEARALRLSRTSGWLPEVPLPSVPPFPRSEDLARASCGACLTLCLKAAGERTRLTDAESWRRQLRAGGTAAKNVREGSLKAPRRASRPLSVGPAWRAVHRGGCSSHAGAGPEAWGARLVRESRGPPLLGAKGESFGFRRNLQLGDAMLSAPGSDAGSFK